MELFSPSDIKWVRNVKANGGIAWAYQEVGDTFNLHWSSRYKDEREAAKPQPGDIILLFQRPNGIIPGTFLTHLVTPVSYEVVDEKAIRENHRWAREVMVIAKPDQLNSILKPTGFNFTKVSRPHSFHIERLTIDGIYDRSSIQTTIWNAFIPYFKKKIDAKFLSLNIPILNDELALEEGRAREVLRKHLMRERRTELTIKKKNLPPDELICECCSFNFEAHYGAHGSSYIECHHRIPIHLGKRITRLEDLALVCANCHRMLHRKNPMGEYYTVKELKDLFKP
jgi:hypothetical protein